MLCWIRFPCEGSAISQFRKDIGSFRLRLVRVVSSKEDCVHLKEEGTNATVTGDPSEWT